MKLELKHLAGYLPYMLKVRILYDEQISRYEWQEFESEDILRPVNLHRDLKNITPILRPLSDLIKEIEVNGEKFIPLNELSETGKHFFGYWREVSRNELDVLCASYSSIQKLLEWHFDIYGLIENGLAIDINTISAKKE